MPTPAPIPSHEGWSIAAKSYASNVGRTSALAVARLSTLINELSTILSNSHILDNGAGAGAVTFTLASQTPSAHILATDTSREMLSTIDSANPPNVSTRVTDARSSSHELQSISFSHAYNTFMLQTINNPVTALREMHSVLRTDGVIGIALWAKCNNPFEIWEFACRSLDPEYVLPDPFVIHTHGGHVRSWRAH